MSVALITSAVKPNAVDDTNLVDHVARLKQTRDAIYDLVKHSVFNKIVVVDGTNTPIFSTAEIAQIYNAHSIEIEQIAFLQNANEVRIKGKSFGELEIVNHAIINSRLIIDMGYFYKLSGRYTISNINEIVYRIGRKRNVFFFDNPPLFPIAGQFVSTIFYKSDVNFFLDVFKGAESECSYDVDGYLEAVFFRRLVKRRKFRCYVPFPWYNAVSGTTGREAVNRHYRKRKMAALLGVLCWSCE
jgi:hypothetical protein